MLKYIFFLSYIFFAINISYSQTPDTLNLAKFFAGNNGAFVVYDQNNNKYIRYNPKRCGERFLPASTFKIANSLIGLETGVIPDENYVIKWDGKPKPIKEWERDHTLRTAIQYSVVPYYQELARRVGKEKMQHWLDTINYGNRTIGKSVDYFWLDNSLKISANEQVKFLKEFFNYKLPVSKRSVDIVKDIISKEVHGKSVLKFKTGTGDYNNHWIAWLVGYVKKDDNVYFYAFNIDGNDFMSVSDLRNTVPREILKYLNILE